MKYALVILLFYTPFSYRSAIPVNGVMNMDDSIRGGLSDTELFQLSINDCAVLNCHTVTWSTNKTLTKTIKIKENVRVLGSKKSGSIWPSFHTSKGLIYADLKDASKDLFTFEYTGGQSSGNGIEDVLIVPLSAGRSVVNLGNAYNVLCRNVDVKSFRDNKKHFETGVRIDGAVRQTIESCDIEYVRSEGFLSTAANTIELKDIAVRYSPYGIRVMGGSIYVHKAIIESCDSSAIQFTGTLCNLDFFYTEGIPKTQSTKAKALDIRKADMFTLYNSDINGGEVPVHVGMVNISLDDVRTATIQGNEIVNCGSALSTTEKTGAINWFGNVEEVPLKNHHPFVYDVSQVNFLGNAVKYKKSVVQNNAIGKLESKGAELTGSTLIESQINNATLSGKINTITPKYIDVNHNLFRWSEQPAKNFLYSTERWIISETMIAQKTATKWFLRYNLGDSGTLKAGEYYTITFEAKVGSDQSHNNFSVFQIDLGDVQETTTTVRLDTIDKSMREYSYTIKIPESAKPANFIDFSWEKTDGDAGDFIFMNRMKLEQNRFKGDYIKTEGLAITYTQ